MLCIACKISSMFVVKLDHMLSHTEAPAGEQSEGLHHHSKCGVGAASLAACAGLL